MVVESAGHVAVAAPPSVHPYESGWDGTRGDLPWIVESLLQADGMLSPQAFTVGETYPDVSAETSDDPSAASETPDPPDHPQLS